MSNSLWPHGLQHARFPCPSLSPRVCSNSCPLSRWCHPTISSSVAPFSSCPQSFPASGSFPVSQFFTSSGQSIGASASAAVLPMNIQGRFPLGLTGLISFCPRKSQESSPVPQMGYLKVMFLTPQCTCKSSVHLIEVYILTQQVWYWAWESASLTSSQVILEDCWFSYHILRSKTVEHLLHWVGRKGIKSLPF